MKFAINTMIMTAAAAMMLLSAGCSKSGRDGAVAGTLVNMTVNVVSRDTKAAPIESVEDFRTRYADAGIAVWAFTDGFSSENRLFSGEVFKYDSGNGYWSAKISREWPDAEELGYGVICGALAPAGCSYQYIEPLGFSYTLPHDIRDQVDFYRGINTGTKADHLELEFHPCLCPVHFEIGAAPEGYHVKEISISGVYDYYEFLPDEYYSYNFSNWDVKDDSPFTITRGVHFNSDAEIPSCVFMMIPCSATGNEIATVTIESDDESETISGSISLAEKNKVVWYETYNVTYTLNFARHLDSFTISYFDDEFWAESDEISVDVTIY